MAIMFPFPFAIICILVFQVHAIFSNSTLPIVDLGYERHQAISFNQTGNFYNFSNIRYAQPPVGNLRFRAPLPPIGRSSVINNGSITKICPQAAGSWKTIATEFVPYYLTGSATSFNYTAAVEALPSTPNNSTYDQRTSEDCLFLDVFVPKQIFESPVCDAPVLVWIFGGGYTSGTKTGGTGASFDPAGLINVSDNRVIYVAINYRLGAFGWLSGPSLQEDGTANAGLYDQRLALEWIQENIHLFGGNKDRVTVMGQSAGGGSILHQITAFGGQEGSVPFSQAIVQSPAFSPQPSNDTQEAIFQNFLSILGVETLEEARQLPSEVLIAANRLQVWNSTYGTNTYGPVVDGTLVPSLPGQLLLEGRFDRDLNIMVAHNSNEGLIFTSPQIDSSATYAEYIQLSLPHISSDVLDYITTTLYPPVFNGTYGYTTEFQRAVITIADSAFICNTAYLDRAYHNETFAYEFSVPPAIHGLDTPYLFMNGATSTFNNTIATALQDYVTSFAVSGVPSGNGIPTIPRYGDERTIVNFESQSITLAMDDIVASRCEWWQQALYY